jgi:cellulose synthase/poly-beta-1,6-N-acetylglucosamine synthase-like glycosyltransferase
MILDLLEEFHFLVISVGDYIIEQFARRDIYNWFLFFFPFIIFFELPRYFLPALLVPVLEIFGLTRQDSTLGEILIKQKPLVSIIVAGRNEAEVIEGTIKSLLELSYSNTEIIIIDDCSDDNMYNICAPYARRGEIKLFRNSAATGRGGRPVASNLGLAMSQGEFIISVDADTSYDRDMVEKMIAPFHNPKVGAVAGNIKVYNLNDSIWAIFQTIEYAISIGLWKRWTDFINTTLQASGAFGAFRREAITDFGGWDPELAEDADISLKAKKCGWDIAFAPYAIAMTNVPVKLKTLVAQRIRWDKGAIRTYFHKHVNIMNFRRFRFGNFFELVQDYLAIYLFPFVYLFYIIFMVWYDWKLLIFALSFTYFIYVMLTVSTLLFSIIMSERRAEEWFLLMFTPLYPFYKEIFRWVRIYANFLETFRLKYEESYIPKSGYKNKPRW